MNLKEGFIICDSYKKEEIIRENKDFKNYIFLTLNELEKKLLGTHKPEAIFMLVERYSLTYEEALEYLRYIPYIENKEYKNLRLDSLVSAKRMLCESSLFGVDEFFIYRLNQYPITFIDIDDNIQTRRIKKLVSSYTEIIEINSEINKYNPCVYEFDDIYDECLYVYNEISKLYKSGISLNKIFINNIDKDYAFIFKRLAKGYNIPIEFSADRNINSLQIANDFLRMCNEKESFNDILNELDSKSDYYKYIMNLIIDYNLEDKSPKCYKAFFYEQFKNAKFTIERYTEMVSTKEKKCYKDDEYLFLVGLNLGSLPKVYKDDEYLNDEELTLISLPHSTDRNINSKKNLINILLGTKNICITYKKAILCDEFLPSNCIRELDLKVMKANVAYGYSKLEDDIRLGIQYTRLVKYNLESEALNKYDISHLKYNTYDNSYKKIDKELLDQRFQEKPLKLAYSSVKTFFGCPYAYFADRILGLNEFKPNMAARLGTFSHAVLEDSYKENFNFNESVKKNKFEIAMDSKDNFYFTVMEDVLRDLITYNREHEDKSMLNNIEREVHIEYKGDGFTFEGYIDKLMYTIINDEIYAVIIDYKTGKDVVSLDNVADGFNLQLPCYMLLLSKYEKFKGKKINIIGIYLQKVNIIALDNTIDIVAQREKAFKLQGFTVRSHELIPMFDPEYDKSTYIAKLSTLKSGDFSKNANIISSDKMDELISLVDEMINQASIDIKKGSFDIVSKNIEGKNSACSFCSYYDLCYKTTENLKYLQKKSFLEESDGDENGLD